MFRSKLFWIFMVLSVLFSVHSIYDDATRPVMDSYSAEAYGYAFEAALYLYIMAYCFAAAVIDSLFISREHANGTLRNKIISGHSRASVYLTELIVCTVTGLIMFIVNLAIISLPFLKFGIHGMDGWVTMRRIILIAVLIIVINALLVLFSMLISSRASSIVWTIVFIIIMIVSSGLIQDKLDSDSSSRIRREEGEYYDEQYSIVRTPKDRDAVRPLISAIFKNRPFTQENLKETLVAAVMSSNQVDTEGIELASHKSNLESFTQRYADIKKMTVKDKNGHTTISPIADDLFLKVGGRDPYGILFSGGVDLGKHHMVGGRERLCKFVQQRLGPGISVGLEYTPEFFVRIAGGGQFLGKLRAGEGTVFTENEERNAVVEQ